MFATSAQDDLQQRNIELEHSLAQLRTKFMLLLNSKGVETSSINLGVSRVPMKSTRSPVRQTDPDDP